MAKDPHLESDPGQRTFGQHLRRSLGWGGLPGFESIPDRPEAFLEALRSRHQ